MQPRDWNRMPRDAVAGMLWRGCTAGLRIRPRWDQGREERGGRARVPWFGGAGRINGAFGEGVASRFYQSAFCLMRV